MNTIELVAFIRNEVEACVQRELAKHRSATTPSPSLVLPQKTVRIKVLEAERRRAEARMCDFCLRGNHGSCQYEVCPCTCNDDTFKFRRKVAVGA